MKTQFLIFNSLSFIYLILIKMSSLFLFVKIIFYLKTYVQILEMIKKNIFIENRLLLKKNIWEKLNS